MTRCRWDDEWSITLKRITVAARRALKSAAAAMAVAAVGMAWSYGDDVHKPAGRSRAAVVRISAVSAPNRAATVSSSRDGARAERRRVLELPQPTRSTNPETGSLEDSPSPPISLAARDEGAPAGATATLNGSF